MWLRSGRAIVRPATYADFEALADISEGHAASGPPLDHRVGSCRYYIQASLYQHPDAVKDHKVLSFDSEVQRAVGRSEDCTSGTKVEKLVGIVCADRLATGLGSSADLLSDAIWVWGPHEPLGDMSVHKPPP
jgi:hypothetical protein